MRSSILVSKFMFSFAIFACGVCLTTLGGLPQSDVVDVVEDQTGYESIKFLHQLLDEDLSGYVDVRESDEFLKDELNVKGRSKDRLKTFHKDDPQITVDELWKSWQVSDVHNWTTDEVVDWLTRHVELPQYSDSFRRGGVNGSLMPRLASNSPEILSSTFAVRDPIHKKKISLKATDAVLFGSPSRDPLGWIKEWIVLSSVLIASCGVWFAYSQRKKYESQMGIVARDMHNIHELERQLRELKETKGDNGHSSGDEETGTIMSVDVVRLQEAEHQIAVLQGALRRAEQRVDSNKWSPPMELELMLQKTYRIELQYFKSKQAAAERQLHDAKEQCQKLSEKQKRAFGAFLSIHGSQLDNVDDGLMAAKTALQELTSDVNERGIRWSRVEDLTGFAICSSSRPRFANEYRSHIVRDQAHAQLTDRRHSREDFDANSAISFDSPPITMHQNRQALCPNPSEPLNRSVSQVELIRDHRDREVPVPRVVVKDAKDVDESASRRMPDNASMASTESGSVASRKIDYTPAVGTVNEKRKKEKHGMKKILSQLSFKGKRDH